MQERWLGSHAVPLQPDVLPVVSADYRRDTALHRCATCGFAISRRNLLHSVCREDVRVRGGL
eukprot:3858874-Alexandrium_andersonii.AAC.1